MPNHDVCDDDLTCRNVQVSTSAQATPGMQDVTSGLGVWCGSSKYIESAVVRTTSALAYIHAQPRVFGGKKEMYVIGIKTKIKVLTLYFYNFQCTFL